MRPRQLYGVRCVLTLVATALLACGDDGNANQIVRVEVTPSTLLLTAIGTERQLSAQAFNAAGELVDEPITWTSSTCTPAIWKP